MGRIVLTHSTYIEGLVVWLKNLANHKSIKTITPGVISRANGQENQLSIKVSRKTNTGFRLLARKGRSVQEVYLVTSMSEEMITEAITIANPAIYRRNRFQQ